MTNKTYTGWSAVPDNLMTATQLDDLEFPRTPRGLEPAATVRALDGRGRKAEMQLYNVEQASPTTSTVQQLATAAKRSPERRRCSDCDARCQRSLPEFGEPPRRLCPACLDIARVRQQQAAARARRADQQQWAAEVLEWPDAVAVTVTQHRPPPTPAGNPRPPSALRVEACAVDGGRLLDVTLRLVAPGSKWAPPDAVPPDTAAPQIHDVLIGRPLIVWDRAEIWRLFEAVPHEELDTRRWPLNEQVLHERQRALVERRAALWRGQIDGRTHLLLGCVSPGRPDRLVELLRRMATDASQQTTS